MIAARRLWTAAAVVAVLATVGALAWKALVYSPPDQDDPSIRNANAAIRAHLEGSGSRAGSRPFCNVWVHRLIERETASVAYATSLCESFRERRGGGVIFESGGEEAGAFTLDTSGTPWEVTKEEIVGGVGSGFWDGLRRVFPPDLAEEIEAASNARGWPGGDGLRERAEVFFARE